MCLIFFWVLDLDCTLGHFKEEDKKSYFLVFLINTEQGHLIFKCKTCLECVSLADLKMSVCPSFCLEIYINFRTKNKSQYEIYFFYEKRGKKCTTYLYSKEKGLLIQYL